ncbi:MAG: Mu transposase C-terminal domain-containing protein [Acutalibacteraceae bacterium]|nr:Mu transposase C-terminal domain-containing protein [Acutalibacteraceae bacterium]
MKNKDIIACGASLYRVLNVADDTIFVMDCLKPKMPYWKSIAEADCKYVTEQELYERTGKAIVSLDDLDAVRRRVALNRYTIIAGVLPFLTDVNLRGEIIKRLANEHNLSAQTIRNYLYDYLIYQNTAVLAPKTKDKDKKLTPDQKNMRWALNKFFYTKYKNSLKTAYALMLKNKYCDEFGVLKAEYPTFNQFRYFYRTHRKLQTYYIARDGIKDYQRNNRPLLGDGVRAFAPNVGVGLLDATICDLYLVDDSGSLIGRPILTACIDAYSGLSCGYNVSFVGGNYSLRGLMLNVITDKVAHCKKYGITIEKTDWNCDKLPGTLVTDKGTEYVSENFEQITELGVSLINLPAYRPDLKGKIEKFFDLVQSAYKKHLKGKGVIEPDFRERGAHDYRKDACLTLKEFETIVLHCIIYYNTKLLLENFPFTEDMLKAQVKPFANCIWNYQLESLGSNLISVTTENLILTLLPRTNATFSRKGLKANGLRYKCEGFTERFLSGGTAVVAYNPEDCGTVWLCEKGTFTPFELIESRFAGKSIAAVQQMKDMQREITKAASIDVLQAQIDLADHIQTIARSKTHFEDTKIKDIRKTRKREQQRTHRNYIDEVKKDEN